VAAGITTSLMEGLNDHERDTLHRLLRRLFETTIGQ
jgi:hypothetical protein